MRMIPDSPYGTNSQAEKRVFDRLRAAFPNAKPGEMTVFHSLNLTHHKNKRFGEIDFLILCSDGLYVIEVKGGGIMCESGTWYSTNRDGVKNKLKESPFKQAETALHGIENKIKEKLSTAIFSQMSIGYGVIFPDCNRFPSAAEWDSELLADSRSHKDIERWLKKLFQYWRNKDGGKRHLDVAALQTIANFLRPDFEMAVPLHVMVEQAQESITSLTEDQMAMVDIVSANPRVICSGGAGTGKTFLAMELARRWTAEGLNVALVCKSPWLKSYLHSRFSIPKLSVTVISALETTRKRQGLEKFDALIIDEGQDLLDMESLDVLDNALLGGLSAGKWCFFHDSNNQSGFFGVPDPDALNYLSSLNSTQIPLRTNCRNTRLILEKIQTTLGADMGVRGAGDGPKIREYTADSKENSIQLLEKEIDALIHDGGLTPSLITILSPYAFNNSCVSGLPEKIKKQIEAIDEYSLMNFPGIKISFAEIGSFKGLENEAVIVVDLICPDKNAKACLANHYVSMSRARSVLSIIYSNYLL